MHSGFIIDRYRYPIVNCFSELGLAYKLAIVFAFAGLTGLMAQFRIPLPFTPVPVTGQVLAVLLSGIFLGGYYGCLSQICYLGFGIAGIPWFSNAVGGLSIIKGITGGYLIGFVPAALLIGWFTKRYDSARRFHFQLLLMLTGTVIIYAAGGIQFSVITNSGITQTLNLAIFPFIPVDLMKATIAAFISTLLLKKSHAATHGNNAC